MANSMNNQHNTQRKSNVIVQQNLIRYFKTEMSSFTDMLDFVTEVSAFEQLIPQFYYTVDNIRRVRVLQSIRMKARL